MSSFRAWFKGIRGKLVGIIGVAVLTTGILGVFSYRTIQSLNNQVEYLHNTESPSIRYTGAMESSLNGISRFLWSAYVEPEKVDVDKMLALAKEQMKRFEERQASWLALSTPETKAKWKEAASTWDDLKSILSETAELIQKNTKESKKEAYDLITAKVRFGFELMNTEMRGIIDKRNAVMKENQIKSAAEASRVRVMIIVLGIGSFLFILIAGVWLANDLSNALARVTKQIADSSRQVASASGQISKTSESMASSSAEQASAVEETSASLQEMTGMVENNVRNAEQGLATVNTVLHSAQDGAAAVNGLKGAMEEILASNKKIETLVKVIEEIGEKTAIIDEIVFQTKLLSFNASVEAERAGEHGRGFAVVAQEVGNLAQMSGKAALEISSIVKGSTKEAKEIAGENRQKVERGGQFVNETAKVLGDIKKGAESVLDGSRQIVSASKEQASGIKQVTTAMDNINKATQETAATSEEAAGAGEELSSQARTLDDLVGQLSVLVDGTSVEKKSGNSGPQTGAKVLKLEPKKAKLHASVTAKPVDHQVKKVATGGGNGSWDSL